MTKLHKKDLENLGILESDKRRYHQRYLYKSGFKYAIVLKYTDFVKSFLEKDNVGQLSNQLYPLGSTIMGFFSSITSRLSSSYDPNKELLIGKEIKVLAQGIIEYTTNEYFNKAVNVKHNQCEKLTTFSFTDKQNRDEEYINEVIYKGYHLKLYRSFHRKDTINLITVNELPGNIIGIELENLIINYYSKVGKIVYCKHNKIENLDIYSDSVTVVLATLSSITTTTINKELLIDGSVVSTSSEIPEVIYC